MSDSTFNLLVLIGLGVAAYWCFTRGPCATWTIAAAPAAPTAGGLIIPQGFGAC